MTVFDKVSAGSGMFGLGLVANVAGCFIGVVFFTLADLFSNIWIASLMHVLGVVLGLGTSFWFYGNWFEKKVA